LDAIYPIVYLDAVHIKLRQDGHVKNTAVHIVLVVDLQGHRDVLGQWVSEGAEGTNFWLSVLTNLQNRGVRDIMATTDGLTGFSDAIQAVFPHTEIQRCLIHQTPTLHQTQCGASVRNSLRYVSWRDSKAFVADLKAVYQAPNRETAETNLRYLGEKWNDKYPMAVRSWEKQLG
jgi:transposase-like protein